MRKYTILSLLAVPMMMLAACNHSDGQMSTGPVPPSDASSLPVPDASGKVHLTDAQWQQRLTPTQWSILREKGTERPYLNAYWNNHATGTYTCAACGLELFTSETKFDSGTGWPSFYQPIVAKAVIEKTDADGMRTEVLCSRCESHLGHVFDDGPAPTGLRFCMNSGAMNFYPAGTSIPMATAQAAQKSPAPVLAAAEDGMKQEETSPDHAMPMQDMNSMHEGMTPPATQPTMHDGMMDNSMHDMNGVHEGMTPPATQPTMHDGMMDHATPDMNGMHEGMTPPATQPTMHDGMMDPSMHDMNGMHEGMTPPATQPTMHDGMAPPATQPMMHDGMMDHSMEMSPDHKM